MTVTRDEHAAARVEGVDLERLQQRWQDAPGIPGFFTTVDHKRLGIRYIVTAFVFFFVAGVLALVMRVQLSGPERHVLGPQRFNEFMTMHGTAMIFLFNTPVLAGFGNYLLPLMIGTRDMAFPRLNAFSYWIFLLAGIFLFTSFAIGHPPDGGWFAYTPYTTKAFTPGTGMDFWGLGVVFVGISTTVGAVNFIVTAFKLRAPGMTLNRMPMFVWSILAMAFMVLFAVPAVTLAAGMLEADRLFGTQFFANATSGGALLYQHLFWFWGHPEVYILFVPAAGMISMIIPVFSRRPLAGYRWVATSLVAVAFMSFGVWVHHMFATGMPVIAMSFFSAVSLLIAIPSGVQFFAWIATMWRGTVALRPPMLYALGFLLIFLLGGITGVMNAVMPFDWQITDTYFVVAHFHYTLNGAVVFPIFAAIYFWWPKMTGRMLDDRLGRWSFWTMFAGFNLAFFPMHVLGFLGMPRRVSTYQAGLGWDGLNLVATIGGFLFATGTLLTLFNVIRTRSRGMPAGADPWEGDSLEWMVSSPPPHYNFAAIPVVGSRHPLWEPEPPAAALSGPGVAHASLGPLGAAARTTPVTSGRAANPETTMAIPAETALPFVAALGVAGVFTGLLIHAIVAVAAGAALATVTLVRWLWNTEVDAP